MLSRICNLHIYPPLISISRSLPFACCSVCSISDTTTLLYIYASNINCLPKWNTFSMHVDSKSNILVYDFMVIIRCRKVFIKLLRCHPSLHYTSLMQMRYHGRWTHPLTYKENPCKSRTYIYTRTRLAHQQLKICNHASRRMCFAFCIELTLTIGKSPSLHILW